jgi:uncharacterized membrane protein
MTQQVTGVNKATAGLDTMQGVVRRLGDETALDPAVNGLHDVASAVASSDLGPALRGDWLGHALHPMLTDLPLGCWMSAGLLDLTGGRKSRRAAQRLIGFGLLAVPVTAAAGLTDWAGIDRQQDRRIGVVHAAGNGLAAGAYLMSWRARRKGHHVRGMGWSMIGGGFVVAAGYLGRHLAFAEGSGTGARRGLAGTAAPTRGIASTARDDGSVHGRGAAAVHDEPVLVDVREASVMLGVPVEQVEALVEEGVLVPASGGPGDHRFADTDVMAVRLLGG